MFRETIVKTLFTFFTRKSKNSKIKKLKLYTVILFIPLSLQLKHRLRFLLLKIVIGRMAKKFSLFLGKKWFILFLSKMLEEEWEFTDIWRGKLKAKNRLEFFLISFPILASPLSLSIFYLSPP